uniref:Radial spoke head 3 n=1 Tax=Varanus komodoensis TaxID=61221 RepID=A0A8D2LUB4_VARKO
MQPKEPGAVSSVLYTVCPNESPTRYGNLMYDRRVVRGNTYAADTLPWSPEPDPVEIQKQREAHRKMLARKRAKEEQELHAPEIESKTRVEVQTELYLEEIADRIIETDMECQTDTFVERPDTPLFVPQKTGADASTQIEEGEIFEFDIEVKPMLEVLVGKTIEQALVEVMEEEELANLRAHQYAYHELRNAEIAEMYRLEEQERRHKEEKERRKMQQTEIQDKQTRVSEKVAARAFALQYLSNLIPSVFTNLQKKGFFYDQIESGVYHSLLDINVKTSICHLSIFQMLWILFYLKLQGDLQDKNQIMQLILQGTKLKLTHYNSSLKLN